MLHRTVIATVTLISFGAGACRELPFKAPAGSGIARVTEYPNGKLVIEISEGSGLNRVVDSSIFAGLKPGAEPAAVEKALSAAPRRDVIQGRDVCHWQLRSDALELSAPASSRGAGEWMLSAIPSGEGRRVDRFFLHSLSLRLDLSKYRSVHVQDSKTAFIFVIEGRAVSRIYWLKF